MTQARSAPDSSDPVAAARALRPLLEQHSEAADRDGRMDPAIYEAFRKANLFRIHTPKRVGGQGFPFLKLIETSAELGRACTSAAWVQLVLSAATGATALMAKPVFDEIFATPDATVCGVVMRAGKARPAKGGCIVSGRWSYASGCAHADWCFVGVNIVDAEGAVVDGGVAFMPLRGADAVPIEDTWQVTGLRATASNTLVVNERFVPAHLIVTNRQMRAPVPESEQEPADRWPAAAYLGLGLTGPLLGATQRLLELVTEKLNARPVTFFKYASQADSEVILESVGRSAIEIDSAWMHVKRAADVLDVDSQIAQVSAERRSLIPANCSYAMELLRAASSRLMDVAGSAAFATSNPIQRLWRDINFGSRHASFNTRLSLEGYGRVLAGRESNSTLI